MTESLTKILKKKKGFTLIELIIVVAIIAILAALAIPKLMGTQDNAKKKADIANAKVIHDATAKLITENSIDFSKALTFTIDTGSGTNNQAKVEGELQNIPIPKYLSGTYKKFYVSIDSSSKDITVSVQKADGSTNVEVYPNTADDNTWK